MTLTAIDMRSHRNKRIYLRRWLYACGLIVLVVVAWVGSVSVAPAAGSSSTSAASTIAMKGRPPAVRVGPASRVLPSPGDGIFRYAEAHQMVVADGARGYYTIARPVVAATDNHSLAELAVSTTDLQQVIEIGWTVDRPTYGDDDTHLFVYHWVNGKETCYNGCGFVPANEPGYTAGMKLPVTSTPVQFSILHHGTEWRLGYNGHLVGSFPDILWNNRFKLTGYVQWFGEVSSPIATPCTNMGNGQYGSSPTAARIERIGFWPSRIVPAIDTSAPNPDQYTAVQTGPDSMRYGGEGDCRTVPSVIGASRTTAANRIIAAGLVTGTIGTVVDPLCEDLNTVLTQSPAPGTRLGAGSPVSFKYGVAPTRGCPIDPK